LGARLKGKSKIKSTTNIESVFSLSANEIIKFTTFIKTSYYCIYYRSATDFIGFSIGAGWEVAVERESADEVFAAKAKLVVAGVLADPTEGPDSALYNAFGYIRESERKSGLTRNKRNPPPAN
jgi:hypothetical protein